MGLLDKVKQTAATATEAAKEAAAKGQAKFDEVQAKKAADGMLRDLGAAVYATRTGRATPTTDSEIERLVAALQSYESEHGPAHAGARVRGGRTDGAPAGDARFAFSASPAQGSRPGVAPAASAHGADALAPTAVARGPPARRGRAETEV